MSDMSSHPIILHPDLDTDDTRAPQTQFVVERQVAFLEALATTGSVRAAARRARVSHQTCYRARRASAGFGRAWDAALVVARGAAEAKLADYAMNGIEEEVWYHGDLVGSRKRVSDRLLLAHLGRLDRMRGDERIEALAEDFDGMILRLRRGEPIEPEVADPGPAEPAQEGRGTSSPGPCNRRSKSRVNSPAYPQDDEGAGAASDPGEPPCDCVGARHGTDRGQQHYRRGAQGPEPVINVAGEGPCCDAPDWPQCRDCPHYPPVGRILREMEEDRPAGAPAPHEQGNGAAVEGVQIEAFCAGLAQWWLLTSEEELERALAEGMGEG
ncbi:hypothetical protein [Qipengyuania sp. R86523]|uniref:hypothetical protein n=1 Tax=Qipengyuania sp. R86523 TaxID=3093862 RepID=UPI0037C81F57